MGVEEGSDPDHSGQYPKRYNIYYTKAIRMPELFLMPGVLDVQPPVGGTARILFDFRIPYHEGNQNSIIGKIWTHKGKTDNLVSGVALFRSGGQYIYVRSADEKLGPF